MSWDLTVRSVTGSIGTLEAARQAISRLYPQARFGSEPSGAEKIRTAEAHGIHFPSFIRESMISMPARQVADFEAQGISLRFHLGAEDIVRDIGLEVRGEGDPFPLLRQLASVEGWQLVDDSTGESLSAESQVAGTGWEIYQKMLAGVRNRTDDG